MAKVPTMGLSASEVGSVLARLQPSSKDTAELLARLKLPASEVGPLLHDLDLTGGQLAEILGALADPAKGYMTRPTLLATLTFQRDPASRLALLLQKLDLPPSEVGAVVASVKLDKAELQLVW